MKYFVHNLLRAGAWILVILGVLFTMLQAFLIGLPALAVGAAGLWAAKGTGGNTLSSSSTNAERGDEGEYLGVRSIEERNDPSSPHFVPNDQDAGNPLFGIKGSGIR